MTYQRILYQIGLHKFLFQNSILLQNNIVYISVLHDNISIVIGYRNKTKNNLKDARAIVVLKLLKATTWILYIYLGIIDANTIIININGANPLARSIIMLWTLNHVKLT